jgi:hypothetical protein
MKLHIALVILGTTIASKAATLTGANFSAPFAPDNDFLVVYDGTVNGVDNGTGNIGLGVFNTLDNSQVAALAAQGTPTAIAQLAADFSIVGGASGSFGFNTLDGLYSLAGTGDFNALAGKSFYSFLSSGGTVGAGQVAIYLHNDVIAVESPTSPQSYSLSLGADGTLILGGTPSSPTTTLVAGPNTFTVSTLALFTPVPEPSTAILGAIGALGLLRRRR